MRIPIGVRHVPGESLGIQRMALDGPRFGSIEVLRRKDAFNSVERKSLPVLQEQISNCLVGFLPGLTLEGNVLDEVSRKSAEVMATIVNLDNQYRGKPWHKRVWQRCRETVADCLGIAQPKHSLSRVERQFLKNIQVLVKHSHTHQPQAKPAPEVYKAIEDIYACFNHALPPRVRTGKR